MEKFKISELDRINFSRAANQLYEITDYNHAQYPEYYKWFYGKNLPRVLTGTGEIIFYLDAFVVVGLTILKSTDEEKKMCTFMINEEYRKRGYSKQLLEDAFDYLGTEKPVITIPNFRLEEFSKIIDSYGWIATSETDDYKSKEIIFNEGSDINGKDIQKLQYPSRRV